MSKRDEIAREQAHVDLAYERLEVLRERARDLGRAGMAAGEGSTFQSLLDRDVFVYRSALRLSQLELGDEPLVFGRLDMDDAAVHHIGRIGIPGEDLERLVVDWRAPAAAAFYQATPSEPLGVVRRRSLLCRADRVLDLEDDLLAEDAAERRGLVLVGEGALLAAVTRAKSDRMRDIVATIQGEQDRIIRSPARGIVVVQGGPGTGKTAVALHRVAYLLYAERERLERRGVLLVGPTRDLLRYIERVLPSLGEQSAKLRTLGSLVDGVDADRRESPAAARILGDERMVEVLERAIELAAPSLAGEERFVFDGQPFTFVSDQVLATRRDVAGRHLPYNQRREHARTALVARLWRGWKTRHQRTAAAGDRRRYSGDDLQRLHELFRREVATSAEFLDLLEVVWPLLTPTEVLAALWRDPARLRAAAEGVLRHDEVEVLLARDPDLPWSVEDVALLDELDARLGRPGSSEDDFDDEPLPVDEYAEVTTFADRDAVRLDPDEPDLFGHVVVDEAQDLSPMQWRMIARRGAGASYTIVGDLAQASGSWTPTSWPEAVGPLGPRPRNEFELTINYRTPREVMDLAGRVLAAAAPELQVPRSVRDAGERPRIVTAGDDLEATVVAETRALRAAARRRHRGGADARGRRRPPRRRPRRGRRGGPRRAPRQGARVRRRGAGGPGRDRGRGGQRAARPLRRDHPRDPAPHDRPRRRPAGGAGRRGARVDRVSARRGDVAWLDAERRRPDATLVLVDGDRVAVTTGAPGPDAILLGEREGELLWAVDVARHRTAGESTDWRPIRDALVTDPPAVMTAAGLVRWHDRTRFCAGCGAALVAEQAGHVLRCPACDRQHFPHIEPAIIVAVTDPDDRLLLARSPARPPGLVSTLAGFVEPGESLEQALRREVAEEVGVRVGEVSYVASQPWPFPSSLMLGFHARAETVELTLEEDEIAEAAWWSRAALVAAMADGRVRVPPPLSIAHRLITGWLGHDRVAPW